MELPQSNTQIPVCSYTRTELLSIRTKTSLLSLSTVDRLKDLNIGYHLPRRHRSSRGVKRKKQNLHSFIAASFNAQSVKDNDMACRRCEISTFIKDNGIDLFLRLKHGLVLKVVVVELPQAPEDDPQKR